VKLVILVIRPLVIVGHTFLQLTKTYDITHGHYSITWPPAYLESCPQFHVQCYTLCTVKPVKLATLVSQPPVTVGHNFMELANSYDSIHGHYSITWLLVYLQCWPQFSRLVLCFTCKFNLSMLTDLKVLYFLYHIVRRLNPHLLYKQNNHFPIQPPHFLQNCGWQEFRGGTSPQPYFQSLLTDMVTYCTCFLQVSMYLTVRHVPIKTGWRNCRIHIWTWKRSHNTKSKNTNLWAEFWYYTIFNSTIWIPTRQCVLHTYPYPSKQENST
jgi:hypothetical protein